MPAFYRYRIIVILLLLALNVSCAPYATAIQPIITQTDTPYAPTISPQPTSMPTQTMQPAQTPRAAGGPAKDQGSRAAQNIPLDVPVHPFDVILGRPTQHSITVSVLTYQDLEGFIEYGSSPDAYSNQTPLRAFAANQPVEVLIDGLQANMAYTYRLRYRLGNVGEFSTMNAETFHTQRAAGSQFTFSVQADSHLDTNSNPQVYLQTLANEHANQPDFLIDLGDTFMTDKYQPYTAAE